MTRLPTCRLLTRRGFVVISGLTSGTALLAACGGASSATATSGGISAPQSTTVSTSAAATQSGSAGNAAAVAPTQTQGGQAAMTSKAEVTIGLNNEPNTLDPHFVVGRNSETFMVNVYDSLVKRDQSGQFTPGLAESWKQIDPTTWQFKLRQGVKFHNGEPFTADAVKFTFGRVLNPATKATTASLLNTIDRVDIIDPTTVNIVTKQPDIMLLARISELYGSILPPMYVQQVGNDTLAIKPNGTGPFKVTGWVQNERMTLEANQDYWRGAPKVSKITIRPILEDAARISALQAGEVQLINVVPYARVSELQGKTNLQIKTIPTPRVFFVAIDPRQAPFKDVRVRQALNYAVDVDAIIKSLYLGHATRLATVVDKSAFGYDPNISPYPFDQAKAKQLLADAGYPNGFDTSFDAFTGSIADHSKPAEAIVDYLRKVGVNAKLNMMEFGAFGSRRVGNQAGPLFIYSFGDWAEEPSFMIEWMMQGDASLFYQKQEILDLLKQADVTFDPDQRKKIYSDVQQKLRDDAGFIYLFQADTVFAMQKNVDFQPRPDELFDLYLLAVKS